MAECSLPTNLEERNEDYTGACCLLVKRPGPRRRKHLTIEVLIDAERLPDVIQFEWVMWEDNIRRGLHYAACLSPLPGMDGWILPLHRYLTNPPKEMVVDHKNRRPGDNRIKNLRICTRQQNSWNTGPARGKSSQYKGVRAVTYVRGRGKRKRQWSIWKASITVEGEPILLGTFKREDYAAFAYNLAASHLQGEFAYLNDVKLEEEDKEAVYKVILDLMDRRAYKEEHPGPIPKQPTPRFRWPHSAHQMLEWAEEENSSPGNTEG